MHGVSQSLVSLEPGTSSHRESLRDALLGYPLKPGRPYLRDQEELTTHAVAELLDGDRASRTVVAVRDGTVTGIIRFTRLDWDSAHFGVGCGRIDALIGLGPDGHDARRRLLSHALEWLRTEGVEFVSCKVDAEDVATAQDLGRYGFQLVSTSVRFARQPGASNSPSIPGVWLRSWQEADLPSLATLARRLYSLTRFHQDPRIPRGASDELPAKWLVGCCHGLADRVTVADTRAGVVGFVTCRIKALSGASLRLGIIDLVGVAPEWAGLGIGAALVADVGRWCVEQVNVVEVETQLVNRTAMTFYVRQGFWHAAADYCFHAWCSR